MAHRLRITATKASVDDCLNHLLYVIVSNNITGLVAGAKFGNDIKKKTTCVEFGYRYCAKISFKA